jgi:sodium-independent sulfate anion transporter 11
MASAIKRYGKRVIGYSEEAVPVVTTADWVKSLSRDPKQDASWLYELASFFY